MTEVPDQWEAPDGSLLVTKTLVEDAAVYLHGGFGRVWPFLPMPIKLQAAGMVLVRAMGYQQKEAPQEFRRLSENHFFRCASEALVAGYQITRDQGWFR